MSTSKVLKFIGKGQITIPQEWRNLLGMAQHAVKATLQGNKIVIETLALDDDAHWDVEQIALNDLTQHDKAVVREGRVAYKAGKTEQFQSAQEFFKE